MNMKKTKLLLITLISAGLTFSQSPWTQNKGEGFSQLSFTFIPENNLLFQKDGVAIETERYVSDNTIQSYNEIGIAKDLSAILVVPFKLQKTGALSNEEDLTYWTQDGSLAGISNISLGLRKGFKIGDWISAVQVKYDFKTKAYDDLSGISTGFDCATINGLYSIGKSINEKNYFFAYTGGSFRTNNYSDLIIFGAEYGHQFFDQLWLIPFIDFNFGLYNGETLAPTKQNLNGFYVNNQEFTAMGFKFIEEINEDIGITAGFGGAFSGNNVAQSPAISIGAYYKW